MSQPFDAPAPSTPAGWYPTSSGDGRLQYWDGATWTPNFHPMPHTGGQWPQAAPPVYAAPPTAPRQRSFAWKVRHSLWLLAPILGFGVFCCVGFVYCAIRVRTRAWFVVASVSVALAVLATVWGATSTDSAGNSSPDAVVFLFQLWVASIIFGALVNRDYLASRAAQR